MSCFTQMEYEIDFGIVSGLHRQGDQLYHVKNWVLGEFQAKCWEFRSCSFLVNHLRAFKLHPIRNWFRKTISWWRNFVFSCIFCRLLFQPFATKLDSSFSIFSLGSWPPKANQFQSLYGIWITRKVPCFATQTNIEFPYFLPCKYETLRTLHKFSGSDKIACSHRNEKCSL